MKKINKGWYCLLYYNKKKNVLILVDFKLLISYDQI